MEIANNRSSMVQLWILLERTERCLKGSYKRFCPANILKLWHAEGIVRSLAHGGSGGTGMLFDVCCLSELEGYELLPSVCLCPLKHRQLLRAVVAVTLGIGIRQVDMRALDSAFTQAFPLATPIDVWKKGRR